MNDLQMVECFFEDGWCTSRAWYLTFLKNELKLLNNVFILTMCFVKEYYNPWFCLPSDVIVFITGQCWMSTVYNKYNLIYLNLGDQYQSTNALGNQDLVLAHQVLRSYTMTCKLLYCLPRKNQQNHPPLYAS